MVLRGAGGTIIIIIIIIIRWGQLLAGAPRTLVAAPCTPIRGTPAAAQWGGKSPVIGAVPCFILEAFFSKRMGLLALHMFFQFFWPPV